MIGPSSWSEPAGNHSLTRALPDERPCALERVRLQLGDERDSLRGRILADVR
jgi:hypothetical protein